MPGLQLRQVSAVSVHVSQKIEHSRIKKNFTFADLATIIIVASITFASVICGIVRPKSVWNARCASEFGPFTKIARVVASLTNSHTYVYCAKNAMALSRIFLFPKVRVSAC